MFGARRSLVTLPGVPRVDYRAKTNADSVKRVMSMHAAFAGQAPRSAALAWDIRPMRAQRPISAALGYRQCMPVDMHFTRTHPPRLIRPSCGPAESTAPALLMQ
jgi:hypothetical protein